MATQNNFNIQSLALQLCNSFVTSLNRKTVGPLPPNGAQPFSPEEKFSKNSKSSTQKSEKLCSHKTSINKLLLKCTPNSPPTPVLLPLFWPCKTLNPALALQPLFLEKTNINSYYKNALLLPGVARATPGLPQLFWTCKL